ncbi:uncharacterized protein [Haliotis cracherodii]|uniref:uncharacterized protein n=1 Tax=Haliotis cracherodii TaxID=6455 RepID=UPI0039EB8C13
MEDMTPAQIKEIKKSFSLIDENGDGRISSHELLRASRLLGMNPTLQDAEAMIKEVDEDNSGYIEFDEYAVLMSHHVGAMEQELRHLKEALAVLDVNRDGMIEVSMLKQVVMMVGERLTEKEVETGLSDVKIHPGNKIKYEEFAETLCQKLL